MRAAKTILLGLLVAATPPAEGADGVGSFHCKSPQRVSSESVREVYAAYGSRSVLIMEAALANNVARLQQMVAPTATFTLFHGDVGIGPRSAGQEAAIDFAKQIAPRSYQFSAGSPGPVAMDPCGSMTAELTLISNEPNQAVVARFKYDGGILTEVQGGRVELIRGRFQTSPR